MQDIYLEPIKPELVGRRVEEMKSAGIVTAASLTPQRVTGLYQQALEAGLDIMVIQGTVVSAEHVSKQTEPLDLKRFIAELDVPVIVGGCASYSTALHLMRTGAVGVLLELDPVRPARRAVCSVSVCLRRRLSPTRRAHVSGTWTKPVATCMSSPMAGCAPAATSRKLSPVGRMPS